MSAAHVHTRGGGVVLRCNVFHLQLGIDGHSRSPLDRIGLFVGFVWCDSVIFDSISEHKGTRGIKIGSWKSCLNQRDSGAHCQMNTL